MDFFTDLVFAVAAEKETGMKELLCIMGVSKRMQWLAWWARAWVIVLPVSLLLSVSIQLVFKNIGFYIILPLVLLYGCSIISLAFFITCW